MHSFFRLQRSCKKGLIDSKIFSATTKSPGRNFASIPLPTNSPVRSRWPIFVLGFTSGLAVSLAVITYNEANSEHVLNPYNFTPFILVRKDCISSTSSIFTLQPILTARNSQVYTDAWKKGAWSLQVKQPQLQIARAYTPLPPVDGEDDAPHSALRFLIRKETRGEVSGYLHNLPLGATVDLRGPQIEYELPKHVDEVLFIAGGTGIAPALQIAHSLCQYNSPASRQSPRIRILWANRRREDCQGGISDPFKVSQSSTWMKSGLGPAAKSVYNPPSTKDLASSTSPQTAIVKRLNTLVMKHPSATKVEYFVDEENSFVTENLLKARLNYPWPEDTACVSIGISEDGYEMRTEPERPPGSKLVIVSGPDGFVKHYAGSKVWSGGQEIQGALGGVLKDIIPQGWEVWKL